MQYNYIKGFVKTAAQPAAAIKVSPAQAATAAVVPGLVAADLGAQLARQRPAQLFDLTLQDNSKNGKPFWDGGVMKINVPGTQKNPIFTKSLGTPFVLKPSQFKYFTPVPRQVMQQQGLLTDNQLRRRIRLIQTGNLKDSLIRTNQGTTSSSSAYGKLQKGNILKSPIPLPSEMLPADEPLLAAKIIRQAFRNRIRRSMPKLMRQPRIFNPDNIDRFVRVTPQTLSKTLFTAQKPDVNYASPIMAAYATKVLRAQRNAFLAYGREPNKKGYQKRFDYSSYKDPTKGIGAEMVRTPQFDALNDKLDMNYMSELNRKAFDDYNKALRSGKTKQQALTAYYNSLAANWYGDYRNKKGPKNTAMLRYAANIRNPNKANMNKLIDRQSMQKWWRNKTDNTIMVPPRLR